MRDDGSHALAWGAIRFVWHVVKDKDGHEIGIVRGGTFTDRTRFITGGPSQDQARADQKALQGRWRLVERTPPAGPGAPYRRVVILGNHLVLYGRSGDRRDKVEAVFTLNTTPTPRAIDFTPIEGAHKGKTYAGIYAVEGKALRIAFRAPGASRPHDFDDKRDGDQATVLLELTPES
jgi:uncharacterized protein (TIGR03067 family)